MLRFCNRIGLASRKRKWCRAKPEDLPSTFIKITRGDKFVDRRPSHEARIQGQQGIRPEFTGIILGVYLGLQVKRPNYAKRARELLIRTDQLSIKIKRFHDDLQYE
ncbi:hypothetical protein D3C77_386150 [compost metagenome]